MVENLTNAEWHGHRAQHIGGSEVASLFEDVLALQGESPFLSRFELWHIKAGNIEAEILDDDRIIAGNYLEPAVARWVADQTGWKVEDFSGGYLSNGKGLGGTPDRQILAVEQEGPGILEIKTVDSLVYRNWEGGHPPLKYQLQLQTYLGLSGYAWGAIAALVGGNTLKTWVYPARPKVFAEIQRRTGQFWDSVARDEQPDISSAADVSLYLKTMRAFGENVADLSNDKDVNALLDEYLTLNSEVKAGEERCKLIQKELADRLAAEEAKKGITPRASISLVRISESPGKPITADMVGQITGGRAAYSYIKITPKKQKEQAA